MINSQHSELWVGLLGCMGILLFDLRKWHSREEQNKISSSYVWWWWLFRKRQWGPILQSKSLPRLILMLFLPVLSSIAISLIILQYVTGKSVLLRTGPYCRTMGSWILILGHKWAHICISHDHGGQCDTIHMSWVTSPGTRRIWTPFCEQMPPKRV